MSKIEVFDYLDRNFIEKVNNFTDKEPFKLFYLFDAINSVNIEGKDFFDAFVFQNNPCKIIGLYIDKIYYLYGENWTSADVDLIRKRINFKSFPNNFIFAGTTNFLNEIVKDIEIKTVDFKDRYFYKIISEPKLFNESKNICLPNEIDIDELALLVQKSHQEEYKDASQKTLEQFINITRRMFLNSDIFIYRTDKKIMGFCSTLNSESDTPMIGTLYINKEYRNKGIGKELLSYVTNELIIKEAKACYLVTERNNIPANKIIKSVGYKIIYEHISKVIVK